MKSLKQLTDELVGPRLNAVHVSLWNVADEVRQYARIAINDAVLSYPSRVEMIFHSGTLSGGAVVLPSCVDQVVRVVADNVEIKHWTLQSTPQTVYLQLHDDIQSSPEVVYIYKQPELPDDLELSADIHDQLYVMTWRAAPHLWPKPPAYLEISLSPISGYSRRREVVQYGRLAPSGFQDLVRNIEGSNVVHETGTGWGGGACVSACWVAHDRDLRPMMLQAQAVMYEFFLRHRALYEQYTAIASLQALGLDDLQLLIRDLESRARNARRLDRHLPPPTSSKLRRPIRR